MLCTLVKLKLQSELDNLNFTLQYSTSVSTDELAHLYGDLFKFSAKPSNSYSHCTPAP